MLLPDRLRAAREKRGLGQRELARSCGISSNQMNRYEQGVSDPTSRLLIIIADELGVTTDYLLGRSDDPRFFAPDSLREDERKLLDAYTVGDMTTLVKLASDRVRLLEGEKS